MVVINVLTIETCKTEKKKFCSGFEIYSLDGNECILWLKIHLFSSICSFKLWAAYVRLLVKLDNAKCFVVENRAAFSIASACVCVCVRVERRLPMVLPDDVISIRSTTRVHTQIHIGRRGDIVAKAHCLSLSLFVYCHCMLCIYFQILFRFFCLNWLFFSFFSFEYLLEIDFFCFVFIFFSAELNKYITTHNWLINLHSDLFVYNI